MTDLFSLKGKQALITGGTRGIGRAIALRFARAGATVIANHVRDIKSAGVFHEAVQKEGLDIQLCRADLTSPKGLDKLIEYVTDQFEAISILVHCAATGVHRPLGELTVRQFDFVYALNVRAFFDLVGRLMPVFDSRGGSILAISSEGAVRAVPQYSLVGSSKGALEALVRHMAVELAPRKIRVNTLSSGTVMTDAWKVLPDAEHRLEESRRRSPIGRLNTVEEVAYAAQFLCSEAASGVVGQTMVVDGGTRIVS